MSKPIPLPDYNLLQQIFIYDPNTGQLRWRNPTPAHTQGPILRIRARYYVVKVNKQLYFQHRIIWKLMTGADPHPDLEVDHMDNNRLNNHWSNLQLLTPDQNKRKKPHKYTVKPGGITKVVVNLQPSGRFRARGWDRATGKLVYLGTFDTREQALASAPNIL